MSKNISIILLLSVAICLSLNMVCASAEKYDIPMIQARDNLADKKIRTETGKKNSEELTLLMRNLITAIIQKDQKAILDQIDEQKGAFVDIKAQKKKAEVAALLADSQSTLHKVFWDDKALKKENSDSEIASYRTYFSRARKIELDFFYYNEEECEIRLNWEGRPPSGILGNPIYHKISGSWKLVSLF